MVRNKLARNLSLLGIALTLAFILLPLWWTVNVSISPEVEIRMVPPHWFPGDPIFRNYIDIFTSSHKTMGTAYTFRRGLLNSLYISLSVTLISSFFGSLAAYALTRLKVRYGGIFTLFVLLTQMLPPVVLVIPLYLAGGKLGLLDTKSLLIICYTALNLPLCIWILRGYFKTLPPAIEDSALIDGCSYWGVLFRIVLPISGPALFTAGLFLFIAAWNEFLFSLVFSSSLNAKTMAVAMAEMMGRYSTDYGLLATCGILGSIIPLIFVTFFQRYLVSGITGGAVKN